MDLVTYVERMPKIGETIIGKAFEQVPGGKGANQTAAIAKLGSKVKILGCIGEDYMGDTLLDALRKDEVDVTRIVHLNGISTGIAAITVDDTGNNCIIVTPGANYQLSPAEIQRTQQIIADSRIIVTQLEIPLETVKYSLQLAKEFGKTTILNPAPAANLDYDLLCSVDLLIPNETELEFLSGQSVRNEMEIVGAAQIMLKRGVKDLIVTTGEKGCLYINGKGWKSFAAYRVDAVDTTAAGDSFIGAMAVGLNEGKTIEEAIPFAMATAALTVTKKGAQSSLPYRHEVDELLRAYT